MADIWDAVALAWEEHADLMEQQLHAATELLLQGVGAGTALLDVAAGAGGAGLAAADREDNPWLGVIFGAVEEQFGVPFPPPGVSGPFSLDDPDALAEILAGAGLEDVTVETVPAPLTTASLDAWWDRVPTLAGPLAAALLSLEPEIRGAIRRRALDGAAAAARRTGAGVTLPGAVLVAAGRRP